MLNVIYLYADYIILLAEHEHDVQILLDALNVSCSNNDTAVNASKRNIVHFIQPSV